MIRLRFWISVVILAACVTQSVEARPRTIRLVQPDKHKYLAYNVGLTSVATLITAVVQHRVSSPLDAARFLLIGSGAGAAFYEAKRLAGADRTTEGWLVANAASTVIENTTSGERLLGRLGYTIGPFRLRFATPLARTGVANIEADWSLAETAFFA